MVSSVFFCAPASNRTAPEYHSASWYSVRSKNYYFFAKATKHTVGF